MADHHYALSELAQESWDMRMGRVTRDIREIIAASQKVIDATRVSLAAANETLKSFP